MFKHQEVALDNFVKSGKRNGWWTKMTAIYVPVWGNATKNAINWVTQTSDGTFNGTWEHGAGLVKGDASSAYFDAGFAPDDFALDDLSIGLFTLTTSTIEGDALVMGANNGTTTQSTKFCWDDGGGDFIFSHATEAAGGTVNSVQSGDNTKGFFLANRDGTTREIVRTNSSGTTVLTTASNADAGTLDSNHFYVSAFNDNGTASTYSDFSWNLLTLGNGLTTAERNIFCYDCYGLINGIYRGFLDLP